MVTAPDADAECGSPAIEPTPTSTPKSELFAWCSRHKVKPPAFALVYSRGTFEGRGALTLPDGSTLRSEIHTTTAKKPIEQAACAELLAALARLFGPEMVPPRPVQKKRPKGAPAAKPSSQEIAANRAAAKEKARHERQERLRKLLEGWSQANAREVLAALKHESFARSVRVRVAAHRGGRMLIEASCERPDGATVHVPPFWATTKEEGEGTAAVELVESIARCAGRSSPAST